MNHSIADILILILPNTLVFGLVYMLQYNLLQRKIKALPSAVLAVLASLTFIVAYLAILGINADTEKTLWFGYDATAIASASFVSLLIWVAVAPSASVFALWNYKRKRDGFPSRKKGNLSDPD